MIKRLKKINVKYDFKNTVQLVQKSTIEKDIEILSLEERLKTSEEKVKFLEEKIDIFLKDELGSRIQYLEEKQTNLIEESTGYKCNMCEFKTYYKKKD